MAPAGCARRKPLATNACANYFTGPSIATLRDRVTMNPVKQATWTAMDLYGNLLESMMAWWGHTWLRRGPPYTLSMLALGLAVCLNVLSIIDLLWTLGILPNPYHSQGQLHPQHYVFAWLWVALLLNTILARLKFSADRDHVRLQQATPSWVAAPTYVLVSTGVFLITLFSALP
jgi:hypothetical protein